MKTKCFLAIFLLGHLSLQIAGAREGRADAAVVVKRLSSEVLIEGDDETDWRWVPSFLRGADIHSVGTGHGGVSEFEVTRSGTLYMAAHYGYEGNASGGWLGNRVTFDELVSRGWVYVANMKHGDGRVFRVFRIEVEAGDHDLIRVNKYVPPYLITLNGQAGTLPSAETPWPAFGPVAISDFAPRILQPEDTGHSGSFKVVPESLRGMVIFSGERRPHGGALEFHVMEETRIYLAGFWGHEGNGEGDWEGERWTLQQMLNLGWKRVDDMVQADGRICNVLTKMLTAGQTHRIRCNKYRPPLLMLSRASYEGSRIGQMQNPPDGVDLSSSSTMEPAASAGASSSYTLSLDPVLSIERIGGDLAVGWFPSIPGSYLEECDDLGRRHWSAASSGTANPTLQRNGGSTCFYRVVIPQ